jgi:hypothetical protein
MKIEPLPKKLYNKAKALKITSICLQFEGGSDEGYLYIAIDGPRNFEISEFEKEIEDWAWDVYEYGGAGEGHSYGDNITYNIEEKTAAHQAWYMAAQWTQETERKLVVKL